MGVALSGCSAKKTASVRMNPSQVSSSQDPSDPNPILFEEEYEAQQRGEVTYDIPVERNAKVEQWISYFQGKGRKWFHIWLERSGRYIPAMRKILREHDLPEDLVYLAMIESGFSSRAYSRARAVGPWQFIKHTGRLYGLQIDYWVDERRDPEKSTIAAARHLKDLYDQFQSWKLAAAAYNAGAGKVSRAIKKYKTEDFWELTKGRYLKAETRHYVPKMIAAALIAKEPEKYGFEDVAYQEPLSYEKIIVRKPYNLLVLAQETKTPMEELVTINPELNHPMIPPNNSEYELRVPANKSESFLQALQRLENDERAFYVAHTVRRGENLQKVAQIYAVPSKEILKANQLHAASQIGVGDDLIIPVTMNDQILAKTQQIARLEDRSRKRRASKKEAMQSVYHGTRLQNEVSTREDSLKKKVHIVRRGETLDSIARRYGTTVPAIKQVNNLSHNRVLKGQRLEIPTT